MPTTSEGPTNRERARLRSVDPPGGGRGGFSRRQRLLSPLSFQEAFAGNRSWPSRTLVLWVRQAPDASGRVGVVAGKRTFRRAVDRNRARRLLREAYRLQQHRLQPTVDIVLLARRRILKSRRQDVEQDLLTVWRAARVLREEETPCRDC